MKNFRRFLVTFAMLFVIILTTACSNKGTDNENKKEEKEKVEVEVEDTTPKEKKNPSKTFVKETPGYKQTVTYYYIESEDRIVYQETITESTYEAYKIGGGNKEKIQKILKEVDEHEKGYSWIKHTLELKDDGFKIVSEINFGTLIYEEAQKVFGENYINPHKEKFSMKQTEEALLKGGYVEKEINFGISIKFRERFYEKILKEFLLVFTMLFTVVLTTACIKTESISTKTFFT